MTEPMTDSEWADVRAGVERLGALFIQPDDCDGWNDFACRIAHRLIAAEARADAAEAERDAALAKERERCIQIVGDRIMAARLGELDADLRSIGRSIAHSIRNPAPPATTAAQED